MKIVICPKCDSPIQVDESRLSEGNSLYIVCQYCGKNFHAFREDFIEETEETDFGHIVVLENSFGFRQEFPLQPGENIIGRRSKGNDIHIPIVTNDPSLGRNHCVINVKRNKQGKLKFALRDFDSITGTFLRHTCLGRKEQANLEHGDVVSVGATTFILYTPNGEDCD